MSNKRSRVKYPALDVQYNLKIRKEQIDFDYIDKLSEEEKLWLNNFMEEYNGANFKHKGKKLHRTKAKKKDCFDKNNSRNRDIYSIAKASETLNELTPLLDKKQRTSVDDEENRIIDKIDFSQRLKKS
jgi:hypothetical protein